MNRDHRNLIKSAISRNQPGTATSMALEFAVAEIETQAKEIERLKGVIAAAKEWNDEIVSANRKLQAEKDAR